MVDALGRVRRRTSGTRLWTCGAGRAGTCMRSEALHQRLTIGRLAADRAGARPYHSPNVYFGQQLAFAVMGREEPYVGAPERYFATIL